MSFKKVVFICFTSVIGLLQLPAMAAAGSAQATTAVNVRTGPGTNFKIVDKLGKNEKVNATECHKSTWCYVVHDGASGWVSAKYLTAVREDAGSAPDQNCRFVFKLSQQGPTFKIECEEPQVFDDEVGEGENENDSPNAPTACLYTGNGFTGAEFCVAVSTHNDLSGMDNIFASLKLFNGAAVTLCTDNAFGGQCQTYTQNSAQLDASLYKRASSMEIFVQFQQAAQRAQLPDENRFIAQRLAGSAELNVGQGFDLDAGRREDVGAGIQSADIQFARATNDRLYIRAVNDALFSGHQSGPFANECKSATYNQKQVSKRSMPSGSYICVKTNKGKYSQLRVENYGINNITLAFETY